MSRRRYLSTDVSTDTAVNKLAMRGGDFAALLYTWMIPHAADDATINGDPEELLMIVMPGRRDKSPEDIADALTLMEELDLIAWDRNEKIVNFPSSAFYKHQSYIKDGERRGANNTADQRTDAQKTDDSANQRKSAQKRASFKSSSSLKRPTDVPPNPPEGEYSVEFETRFWAHYPKGRGSKSRAFRLWQRLTPEDKAAIDAALPLFRAGSDWQRGFHNGPDVWLGGRQWENPPTNDIGLVPAPDYDSPEYLAERNRELFRRLA